MARSLSIVASTDSRLMMSPSNSSTSETLVAVLLRPTEIGLSGSTGALLPGGGEKRTLRIEEILLGGCACDCSARAASFYIQTKFKTSFSLPFSRCVLLWHYFSLNWLSFHFFLSDNKDLIVRKTSLFTRCKTRTGNMATVTNLCSVAPCCQGDSVLLLGCCY